MRRGMGAKKQTAKIPREDLFWHQIRGLRLIFLQELFHRQIIELDLTECAHTKVHLYGDTLEYLLKNGQFLDLVEVCIFLKHDKIAFDWGKV